MFSDSALFCNSSHLFFSISLTLLVVTDFVFTLKLTVTHNTLKFTKQLEKVHLKLAWWFQLNSWPEPLHPVSKRCQLRHKDGVWSRKAGCAGSSQKDEGMDSEWVMSGLNIQLLIQENLNWCSLLEMEVNTVSGVGHCLREQTDTLMLTKGGKYEFNR